MGTGQSHTLLPTRPSAPKVTVVIPAKDEALNLQVLLPRLPDVYEVILVDGNSTDATVEVARTLLPGITVINQTRRGKGNALACGFAAATGDIIVMFDADCSADPKEIFRFVDALVAGADFAKGSRFLPGGGSDDITRIRALGNRVLVSLANRILGTRYSDLCYGYNAFWTDVLPTLQLPDPRDAAADGTMLAGDGFEIETVINCRIALAELNVQEVPSHELHRAHGVSNLRAVPDGLRVLHTIRTEARQIRHRRRAGVTVAPAPLWPLPREVVAAAKD